MFGRYTEKCCAKLYYNPILKLFITDGLSVEAFYQFTPSYYATRRYTSVKVVSKPGIENKSTKISIREVLKN